MFIDLKKFKKGQMYSLPEWSTPTHKESLFVLNAQTFKYIASKEDGFWTVKAEPFSPNFLEDDYFEVFDPLHFYTPECKQFIDFKPPVFGTGPTLVQERPNGYTIFRNELGVMDGLNVTQDTGKTINLEGVTPFVIKDQSKI